MTDNYLKNCCVGNRNNKGSFCCKQAQNLTKKSVIWHNSNSKSSSFLPAACGPVRISDDFLENHVADGFFFIMEDFTLFNQNISSSVGNLVKPHHHWSRRNSDWALSPSLAQSYHYLQPRHCLNLVRFCWGPLQVAWPQWITNCMCFGCGFFQANMCIHSQALWLQIIKVGPFALDTGKELKFFKVTGI